MTTSSSRSHTINPLGTDGFRFVEYTAPDLGALPPSRRCSVSLGFAEVAKPASTSSAGSAARGHQFCGQRRASLPGGTVCQPARASVCGMAFQWRMRAVLSSTPSPRGQTLRRQDRGPWSSTSRHLRHRRAPSPFVDRYGEQGSIHDVDFVFYPDWQARMAEVDAGLYGSIT